MKRITEAMKLIFAADNVLEAKDSFEAWMKQVNAALEKAVGLSSEDLADYAYRDAYDAGKKPASVAKAVIKANKDEF